MIPDDQIALREEFVEWSVENWISPPIGANIYRFAIFYNSRALFEHFSEKRFEHI